MLHTTAQVLQMVNTLAFIIGFLLWTRILAKYNEKIRDLNKRLLLLENKTLLESDNIIKKPLIKKQKNEKGIEK